MNISLSDQFSLFASDVMCDVCAHFLRNVYFIEKEYTSLRSPLYSKYGQKTLIQSLHDLPLEFFTDLKDYSTSQQIDNDVFDQIVSVITAKSEWFAGAHAGFYETCGKITILGIVAMEHKHFTESKIHEEITKMAKKAYDFNILDKDYDVMRKNAQSMLYTVFKINGTDINEFVTPVEREIGFEDFHFQDLIGFIRVFASHTIDIMVASENFKIMNRTKLDFLAKKAIDLFNRSRNEHDASNFRKYFFVLVIQVGCICLYCARNNFKVAVQYGFDYVTSVILKERRLSSVTNE